MMITVSVSPVEPLLRHPRSVFSGGPSLRASASSAKVQLGTERLS
jgi:hypothetical protein